MAEGDAREDLAYESWLEEERVEQQRKQMDVEAEPVLQALGDGQLKVLGTYLKGEAVELADLPEGLVALPRWLADAIVELIEGDHWFRLVIKSRKRGQKRSDYLRGRDERFRVGYFVEARVRQLGPGHHESVIEEAIKKHSHHRSYVTKAHAEVRKGIDEWTLAGGDGWRLFSKLYAD